MIILGGPTASGKSSLAMGLARTYRARGIQAEILCADSITVYRGFEIGAAKPTREEREEVPHHLLDLVDADQNFTAGDFLKAADPVIRRLLTDGKIPIVVGGTGFYLRALLRGMASGVEDAPQAAAIKAALEARAQTEGWPRLYEELIRLDPGSVSAVHSNDHYRIIRALQAMELHGKPWSALNREARNSPPRYPARFFKLKTDKEDLRKRIESRTEAMLRQGLVQEVKSLLAAGVDPQGKPMQSVGYRECVEYLSGSLPESELQTRIVHSTAKLAKQQQTWFKGEELAQWLDPPYLPQIQKAINA